MKKRILTCMLVFILAVPLVLSGCSKGEGTDTTQQTTTKAAENETDAPTTTEEVKETSQFPIREDKITLKMVRRSWTDRRPPASELWLWKRYEEMTNIHIEWEEVPRATEGEKRNIIMATNDLPDAFYQFFFPPTDINRYGSEGTFIDLKGLIGEHGPSLTRIFEENSDVRKEMTTNDGKIFSLPYISFSPEDTALRYHIKQKWLDNLNLKVPTTLDELTNALREFKAKDANANGDPNDEIPVYYASNIMSTFYLQFMGNFGLGNRGQIAAGLWIDMGTDGDVRFTPYDPAFKEMLQYINMWWDEGLMHSETFNGIDFAKAKSDTAADLVGLYGASSDKFYGTDSGVFTGFHSVDAPNKKAVQAGVRGKVISTWPFMITNVNKYPVETMKWVDYFYSEEGQELIHWGEEGVTFTRLADGTIKVTDEVLDKNPDSIQFGLFEYTDGTVGGNIPSINPSYDKKIEVYQMKDIPRFVDNFNEKMPEEVWPVFSASAEEDEEIRPLLTAIGKHINEMRLKYIMGEASFDQWETEFIEPLQKMGADRYLELKQQQYDRYSKD
jgi:putative aldouronate transport system substrate-binding protein